MSRLDALREMLQDDPADAFTRYAVAMELLSQGQAAEAEQELATTARQSPEYVPTWFHWGKTLNALGKTAEALEVLKKGAGIAKAAGEDDAAREIEELIETLAG